MIYKAAKVEWFLGLNQMAIVVISTLLHIIGFFIRTLKKPGKHADRISS